MEFAVAVVLLGAFTWWNCFTGVGIAESVDYRVIYRPNFEFAFESLRAGEMPWWNPYLGLGRPLMTDVHYGLWYPPTYLLMLFGESVGLFLLILLHLTLLWSGTRRLVLEWGGSRQLAFVAGLVVCLTGNYNGRLLSGMLFYVFEECYAPWILVWTGRFSRDWRWGRVTALAVVASAAFLCGNGHVFWILGLGAGLYRLLLAMPMLASRNWSAAFSPLAQWMTAMAGVAGLCCFAWWPYLDLIFEGNRGAASFEFSAAGSANWRTLFTLVDGVSETPAILWEQNFFISATWLIGGLVALITVRDPRLRAAGGVTVFGLLFALGNNGPLFWLCYEGLPGTRLFRVPPRIMVWPTLLLVVAAAVWFSTLGSGPRPGRRIWFAPCAVLAWYLFVAPQSYLGLPGVDPMAWWPILQAAALLAFMTRQKIRASAFGLALSVAAASLVEFIPYTGFVQKHYLNEIMDEWKGEPVDRGRVDRLTDQLGRLAEGRDPALPPARMLASPDVLAANWGMFGRSAGINSDTPLFLSRPWQYLHAIAGVEPDPVLNHTLPREIFRLDPTNLVGVTLDLELDEAGGRVQPCSATFPRAYFSSLVLSATNRIDALAAVAAGVPLGRAVIVENPTAVGIADPTSVRCDVTFKEYTHNRMVLDLSNQEAGYLVLNESWFPGWSIRRGETILDTEPVNVWMRGGFVAPGTDEICFEFRPRNLLAGLLVSFGCALSLGLLIAGSPRIPQKARSSVWV